jgi:hypothetical protein
MEWVVAPSVVVFIAQAGTNVQTEIRGHSDVAGVEQSMEIGPEQEPVSNFMRPIVSVGADVRSFKGGKRVLFGDGTRASVRIEHDDAERGLPKARLHQARVAITGTAFRDDARVEDWGGARQGSGLCEAGVPHAAAFACREVVPYRDLRPRLPISRLGNPGVAWEEDGCDKLDTADVVGSGALVIADAGPDVRDAGVHVFV